MGKFERVREPISGQLRPEYFSQRSQAGWRPVWVEWERPIEGYNPTGTGMDEDIPYGLRISNDCLKLEENPAETEVLLFVLEWIVQDRKLSGAAIELNRQGYRTRNGAEWTAASIFDLLPRLIDAGPRLFTSEEWIERRRRLAAAM